MISYNRSSDLSATSVSISARTLMELGGWTGDSRMLDEIYAHSTDQHKAEVMMRMGVGSTYDD